MFWKLASHCAWALTAHHTYYKTFPDKLIKQKQKHSSPQNEREDRYDGPMMQNKMSPT